MLFAPVVFLSAFLLFDLQPLISKHLLPRFGGAAAVWTVALVMFQFLLLAGYACAHWLSLRPPRAQARLHLVLALASLLWLAGQAVFWSAALLPPVSGPPQFPLPELLGAIFCSVGPVFFLLATTSPLLQRWYFALYPGRSPFVLYAFSNAGSLAALLAFPLVLEPWLTLTQHAWSWSLAYLVLLGLLCFLGRRFVRSAGTFGAPEQSAQERPAGLKTYLGWLALSGQGTLLLVAVSNKLTQDLASVPMLWLVPLALYLLSFMVAFSGRWEDRRRLSGWFYLLFSLLGAFALLASSAGRMLYIIIIYCGFLFSGTLFVHGALYRLRPPAHRLTAFYLTVSAGGVLGGLTGSLAAPLVFKGYFELHLALVLGVLAFFLLERRPRGGQMEKVRLLARAAGTLVVLAALLLDILGWRKNLVYVDRNFYGSIKVTRAQVAGKTSYWQIHGTTCHGLQVDDESWRDLPTSYYSPASGVGLAIERHPRRLAGQPLKIGLVGLGIGTLAAYGKAGDRMVFYEINPLVLELARGRYFSYLSRSKAHISIRLGDGRLLLEEELAHGEQADYHLLIIDAFSSDSVPVHLLTREAFSVYLRRLAPEGVLALHTSNKYLAVEKAALVGALDAGLTALEVEHLKERDYTFSSQWVLAGRPETFPGPLANTGRLFVPGANKPPIRPWEDRFSNILDIVRF